MASFNKSAQLWIETCFRCKTSFGISNEVYQIAQDRREDFSFYCPNGHSQCYVSGETEETKLRRERDRLNQDRARLHDIIRDEREAREAAERRAAAMKGVAAAMKGVATKMKNRIKAGVCPCCNRTFQDLARHISSKHPDIDNVVNFDAPKVVA